MSCLRILKLLSFWVLFVLISLALADDFTSSCPTVCNCKWHSGNKAAICENKSISSIPANLSNDVQILDLNNNPLYEIVGEAFQSVGLSNLKKLILKNCSLQYIHKKGFSNLKIVIELDLSRNQIKTLHPDTFVDNEKLRNLYLNHNYLEKLEDGLFRNLSFLQKVEISYNRLFKIGSRTFEYLPNLKILTLNGNNLTLLKVDTIDNLRDLSGLVLDNNPWKCDCSLQAFRNYIIDRKLYAPPTSCAEPPQLLNRQWNELDSRDFACKPNILDPVHGSTIQAAMGENVTLSCKVKGNPSPDVNWVQNSRIIDVDPRKHGDQRFVLKQSGVEPTRWVNLTIINLKFKDNGEYTCVAKNPGGVEERSVSLTINRVAGTSGSGIASKDNLLIFVIVFICVVLLILVITILICCCYCKSKNSKRHAKSDMHSTNGEALIGEGSVIPEIEKSLITTVNPVIKPPRRYDVPASVVSNGTEMSELNKTLLDNDSVFAPNEDESRSMDFNDQHPKSSRDAISISTSTHGDHKTYPPDLLTFPPRGGQASPAASSASTAPDSTRLPQQVQQSPIHSPIYATNPNHFKTISHSRSQSPFTSPCAPVAPRIGYVTIPRKPRIPSWGSTTSYMTIVAPADYVEPVYDNLGLRTTADGSSVLSLNKAGLEQQLSPIMRGRPLPSTPGSYQGPLPVMYAPIEEHDQAPSPAPSTPYSATLPRIGSSSLHYQISPDGENKRKLSRDILMNDQIYDLPRHADDERKLSLSNGTIYDTPSANDTLGRNGKIPPRPPPKPKKKNSSNTNGPLFEDEGEDGTEV